MNEFLARLKQRKLVQWALAYIAAAFALIQVLDVVASRFDWPVPLERSIILALAVGFVVALVVAWYHGEKGRQRVSGPELLLLALVLAIGGGAVWFFGRGATQPIAVEQTTAVAKTTAAPASTNPPAAPAAFNPSADSIVVLPFQNLGGDPKQQYFSDGITEELTDALGQNPALRVIAWNTASKFRGDQQATEVGRQLNVAYLMHGSILREGDQVRITAELVETRTGYQVWSQHYDGSFKDIFAVQDQVTKAIAVALQVKFARADLPAGDTTNPEAHELVLKGRALLEKFDGASLEAARKDFEQAIALDPDYADAHALLSHTLLQLTQRTELALNDVLPQVRAEAEKALALDPRNAEAWVDLGLMDQDANPSRIDKSREEHRKAIELDPSHVTAYIGLGLALPLKPGLVEFQKALLLDPDSSLAQLNVAFNYMDLGEWERMQTAVEGMIRLDPENVDGAFMLAYARQHLRQYDQMATAFDLVKPATPLDRQQADTGRLVFRAVVDPALRPQALAALKDLNRHRSNFDVAINLLVMYAALDERTELLQLVENLCPAGPTYCNDLSVNPWYTSLRGDPRFEALVKRYDVVSKPAPAASAASAQP